MMAFLLSCLLDYQLLRPDYLLVAPLPKPVAAGSTDRPAAALSGECRSGSCPLPPSQTGIPRRRPWLRIFRGR